MKKNTATRSAMGVVAVRTVGALRAMGRSHGGRAALTNSSDTCKSARSSPCSVGFERLIWGQHLEFG
jgi:hypothetical protein